MFRDQATRVRDWIAAVLIYEAAIAIDNIGFIGYCTPNQSIYAYFYLISYTYFIFIFVFGVANIISLLVNFLNTLIAI